MKHTGNVELIFLKGDARRLQLVDVAGHRLDVDNYITKDNNY